MRKIVSVIILVVLAGVAALFLLKDKNEEQMADQKPAGAIAKMENMKIESPAFADNQKIPARYTCDGEDINPPLAFSGVPAAARSLALVVDDPDAPGGTWDHWIVWNMTPDTREIKENALPFGKENALPAGTVVGLNSWPKNEYGGPCPPDREHRYFFKLYALDTMLDLPPSFGKEELLRAMEGRVLAQAQLLGRYARFK